MNRFPLWPPILIGDRARVSSSSRLPDEENEARAGDIPAE
jgi:hypothetical protein